MIRICPTAAGEVASPRTIAIGDVHGCDQALLELIAQVRPTAQDTIVTLGDYVDRGPNSRGVLDVLIQLRSQCHLVPLLGNHEQMLFSARASHAMTEQWLRFGGQETLNSYGPDGIGNVPAIHWSFLESCRLSFETATHLFFHANYAADRPANEQDEDTVLSVSLSQVVPAPHISGKQAILGHSAQSGGRILDLGHLKCIDTDCWNGGFLTALDVVSGEVWQVRGPRGRGVPTPGRACRSTNLSEAFRTDQSATRQTL